MLTSQKHFLLALLRCSSLLRCFQNLGSHDNTVTQKQGVGKLSHWLALPRSPLMTFCHCTHYSYSFAHLTWSCCRSVCCCCCCCWRDWTAVSWTHCHSPDTGTCSPGTAAPTTCWRQSAASHSGCRVRNALQDKTPAGLRLCAVCTNTQTHRVYIHSAGQGADGLGVSTLPFSSPHFSPHLTLLHSALPPKPSLRKSTN